MALSKHYFFKLWDGEFHPKAFIRYRPTKFGAFAVEGEQLPVGHSGVVDIRAGAEGCAGAGGCAGGVTLATCRIALDWGLQICFFPIASSFEIGTKLEIFES